MNQLELLHLYGADERLRDIAFKLGSSVKGKGDPIHLHIQGLVGSSSTVIAAALHQLLNYPSAAHPQTTNEISLPSSFLFILNDKEEAAYFQNDLQQFIEKLNGKEVLFLSDSFRRPGHFDEWNNSYMQLRTEVLNRIANSISKNEIIVTYPEALMEKVVSANALRKSTALIKMNEKFDEDFMIEVLVSYGFERVDFVYEPGQFAIRGGIIDIFSFGNDLPYRVELFGNEVESIRVFDPLSQLSQRKIAQVTIVPNIQTQFSGEEKISLFDFIPTQTIVWFQDVQFAISRIESSFQKAQELYEQVQKVTHSGDDFFLKDAPSTFFIDGDWMSSKAEKFTTIEFGKQFFFPKDDWIRFDMEPQPSVNKNFNLLINYWQKYKEDRFQILLFSDNTNQFQRLDAIFEDLKANIIYQPVPFAIREGFIDKNNKIACYTDHQIFERYHRYHLKEGYSRSKSLTLKMLRELRPGDFVTHIDYGVGVFSGLEKIAQRNADGNESGQLQEAVRLIYRDNDLLYVNIQSLHKISKYVGKEGTAPRVNKLGTDVWESLKRKTKSKVKDIAKELIELYAKRKATTGFAFSPDSYLQTELEASFIYEDTPDQLKATNDTKRDMEKSFPMDRLVCGDVGFGKTEVAVRAAFKAVADSRQVALLVPTTILALQHYKTFSDRLKEFPCTIDYINRFKSSKQQKETIAKLEQGQIDIIIGTSSLLGQKIKFKDLGLLIIDEEQKFGVSAKEKLRHLKTNVDTLTLTATPIPRTLQFSMLGARDLSIINTPPPNRQPIETELMVFDPEKIKEAVEYEIGRGGQVFFIHNRVKDIGEVAAMLHKICAGADITVAHGQLEGHILEDKMMGFIERRYDVLVCTNIVESGLDIPNANTIIINDAQNFGLSDLHQLRGRVGRSNKKAFCYLVTPPLSTLTSDARKRIKTIEEFSDLGSGFQISMRDMDIRGAGNLLGAEQSGFIADIGYDTYHKILDEAVRELKESDFKELFADEIKADTKFVRECTIDTDAEMLIPDLYVSNINERLALYTELDNIDDDEGIKVFAQKLRDRFGPLPKEVNELFDGVRLRKIARQLGFEKLQQRRGILKCYTVENPESTYYDSNIFAQLMGFILRHAKRCSMRQMEKNIMISIQDVKTIHQAMQIMEQMMEANVESASANV
ncbi:MAG: transcription-repair coupling factor [Chitinophagales bacterium]|nr:transcription-repair coupling factor [Chitinophagales bacterium]